MRRATAAAAVLLLACAARAEDVKDAPAGLPSAPAAAWRTPPGAALRPAAPGPSSLAMIGKAWRELASEPDGPEKRDLLGALAELTRTAESRPAEERQAWIDSHLGGLNAAVRDMGAGTPPRLARKAAAAAARLNLRAERWLDAREAADKALAFSPDDPEALVARSRAGGGLGDFARAYADAERASRLAPRDATAFTARAAAAYGLGHYLQAMEDARRALALDPEDKLAFALMKLSEGRARPAPAQLSEPPARLADSVEREYHGMLQQLSQADERRKLPLSEALPPAASRLTASAGSRLAVKDYVGAVEDADKALALHRENPRALYYRAAAHNLLGEYGEAARDATRGLALKPGDTAMRGARAWAYNRMGRFTDAVADAHAALEIDPNDAYAYANRAFAREQSGESELMLADYKRAAELNAGFEPAYKDAARRHGLAAEGITGIRGGARGRGRFKLILLVAVSSLAGGMLIALGLTRRPGAAPAASAPPRGAFEAAYELGKPIGQGGMGVVYEGRDRKLNRAVAVKVLRDEYKLDASSKQRFIEEARTVAELHHPAIVDIHSIEEDERGVYLVFERLSGRTLDHVLAERGALPLGEIKSVMRPVCDALEYAHARDVVHRDLKPANVMLLDGGGIKVLDFGISRHAARAGGRKVTDTVTGTPHYMAPEQEYGFVQKENDVFSLGAVVYEMAVGARPYEGSHQAKLAKAFTPATHRVRGLTPGFDALIDAALEPDASKRIPSPAEFWRRLDALPS